MIRAVLHAAGDLRLEQEALDPEALESDQVYVATELSALSTGTELGNYAGRSTEVPGAPDYPRAIGYSNVGVVRKTGRDVSALVPGERVFSLKPHQSAYVARQNELLISVPEGVASEQAALSYFAQLGVCALRQANYRAGEVVAVVGLGVIGLSTVGIARAFGAKTLAFGNHPLRADAAKRVGAHAACWNDEGVEPAIADLVVLAADSWEAYELGLRLARRGGRVSVLGFPGRGRPPPAFNPLAADRFYGKQLSLIAAGFSPRVACEPWEIRFNLRRNLEHILELMAQGALDLSPLISHRIPARRMREAYELAAAHDKRLIAAVFDWRDEW